MEENMETITNFLGAAIICAVVSIPVLFGILFWAAGKRH
jgi:hypothetical protein